MALLFSSFAEEGMIIPSLLQAFESDMKAKGMKLTAADIYSVNNGSLKDLAFEALKFVEDEDLMFRHWVTFHVKDNGEVIEVEKELKF